MFHRCVVSRNSLPLTCFRQTKWLHKSAAISSSNKGFQKSNRSNEVQDREYEFSNSPNGSDSLARASEQGKISNDFYHAKPEEGARGGFTEHQHTGHVNLQSCMQSTVPHPYDAGDDKSSHLSARGTRDQQGDKFLAGNLNKFHPSKSFSTYARKFAQPAQDVSISNGDRYKVMCPEGVQGENCEKFKVWLENCHRFQLNCDDQLQGIQDGRKTLAEVFAEQEELIKNVATNHKNRNNVSSAQGVDQVDVVEKDYSSMQGVQDPILLDKQTVNELYNMANPCPQGIQGDDCATFKIWLENCVKYNFANCDEQLQGIQSGRKTLAQVFQEQEVLISKIAEHYQLNQGKSDGSQVGSGLGPDKKMSQKDRLKRAVKEYGATVVVFHIGISLVSLGSFYLAVSSGLDVIGLLRTIGVGGSLLESKFASGASTFVIAYAIHKLFVPVRMAITVTCTPFIVRYLRRVGFLKPPKPKV